jgi:hypothetical protein
MLVDAATLLEVPVLATEQYPKGVGHLQPEVAEGFRRRRRSSRRCR